MAYLTKKHGRNYIRDYKKEPVLDAAGLPVKDKAGNIIYKNTNIWIKSSKDDKLANIELGKYEEDKDRGRIGLEKKHTAWHDIKGKYLAYSRANKAKTSVALDEQMFQHLEEFYPAISSVSDLNVSLCEKFFEWLKTDKHNSEATVKRKGTTLKNLGVKLVDWEITQINPLQKLKIPKVKQEKEIKYWRTPEEMQKVINKSIGTWKTINMVGFCIGTRLAEMLSLSFDSFDFKADTYKIESIGNFRTKSRKFRIGKIPPVLKKYLLILKKKHAKNPRIKTNKIVAYNDGTTPTVHSASSYLRKFYKRIGFEGYHPHCLRHTFAAHYLFKYKDIYGLSQLLGHSNVQITQKYYGHLLGNYFDSSMAKFNPFK
ncbi:MAG: tyrosine-type recombinase/integrase [Endomicrobium sp.]|jgi:integrase|nr:tyrosine-type recombinase/integrase [Endomicrobium sp.]